MLVLEMGLAGAKFEHSSRVDVGLDATFTCGPLTTPAVVRHSVLLPAKTGVVYQSGISFSGVGDAERELLLDLLVHEAQEQVVEWEANLAGEMRERPPRRPSRFSAVAVRYVRLRLTNDGWLRTISSDPNQPLDGITIVDGTPEEEIDVLRETYEQADEDMRELMRRVATVAVLEQLR